MRDSKTVRFVVIAFVIGAFAYFGFTSYLSRHSTAVKAFVRFVNSPGDCETWIPPGTLMKNLVCRDVPAILQDRVKLAPGSAFIVVLSGYSTRADAEPTIASLQQRGYRFALDERSEAMPGMFNSSAK